MRIVRDILRQTRGLSLLEHFLSQTTNLTNLRDPPRYHRDRTPPPHGALRAGAQPLDTGLRHQGRAVCSIIIIAGPYVCNNNDNNNNNNKWPRTHAQVTLTSELSELTVSNLEMTWSKDNLEKVPRRPHHAGGGGA